MICTLHYCNLCTELRRVANIREFPLMAQYGVKWDGDIGRPVQLWSSFYNEKEFRYLNSSCPQLLDNMHLALGQPLYRAWIRRECTRISIEGTIRRCMGMEILAGPYSFVRLLHRERVYIFKLFMHIASS